MIAGGILHVCRAFAVRLVNRACARFTACLHGATVGGINIRNVNVERSGPGLTPPGELRAAAAEHQAGIADANLAVDSTSGADGADNLLAAEDLLDKVDECGRIFGDKIRRDRLGALVDRGGAGPPGSRFRCSGFC